MQDRFKFRFVFQKDFGGKTGICYKTPIFNLDDAVRSVFENEILKYTNFGYKLIAKKQCTGLKDKNGKLIYEGDIVQILGDEIPYVIEFEQDRAMFVIHSEIDKVCCNFDNYSGDDLYVIGNIYENPELLEDKND